MNLSALEGQYKILVDEVIENPVIGEVHPFSDFMRVDTDAIREQQMIRRMKPSVGILKKKSGDCSPNWENNATTFDAIYPNPVPHEVAQTFCADELRNSSFAEKIRRGNQWPNLNGTQMWNEILRQALISGIRFDMMSKVYFGEDGSGNAVLDGPDGFMTTMIAEASTGYNSEKVGSDITTLNQTAGTRAIDYINEIYQASVRSNIFNSTPKTAKYWMATPNVYTNLEISFANRAADNFGLMRGEFGETFSMFGIPIYNMSEFGWAVSQYGADTLGGNTFIVLGTKQDKVLALETSQPDQGGQKFAEIDVWYEKKDKKLYTQCDLAFDYFTLRDDVTAGAETFFKLGTL